MRTNFNIKGRRRRRNSTTKWVAVFVVIATLTVLQMFRIDLFGGFMHSALRPLLTTEKRIVDEARRYITLLSSKYDLARKNSELENRIKELKPAALLIETLRNENNELKGLLNRSERDDTILASVLAKPSVSLYDTFIIDVGETDNILKGDFVLVYGDFIVGTITEVYRRTSLVTLFSSGGRKTDVTLGDEHLLVSALGRGGGNFVTQLPRGVEVLVDDIVILPNISTQIFGVVEQVLFTPADQFQTILFKNPINMAEVTWVEVRLDVQ